jgi:hypothetical protein
MIGLHFARDAAWMAGGFILAVLFGRRAVR